MIRFILINALLFLIPFALYAAYIYLSLHRDAAREQLSLKVLGWLSVAGIALSIIVLVVLTNYTGHAPDGRYEPPRYVDGVIVPGRIVPPGESTETDQP